MTTDRPVVIGSEEPVTQIPQMSSKTSPKWEENTRDRVKAAIKRFQKPLKDLIARDANEGDTRLVVTDFLCDALGYDKFTELTTEYQVKGEFADYGIRIDKDLVAFVEAKRAATKLAAKHLRQVEMYAVNEGVEWLILTNGSIWQVYHVTGGLPVVIDLAFAANLLSEETVAQKAKLLFYLTKESLKRRQIDELWKRTAATSPKSMAKALLSPEVLLAVRRSLKRKTGQNIDESEIANVLRNSVLNADCFDG
jgi:predicted type IV restriction endonuclease